MSNGQSIGKKGAFTTKLFKTELKSKLSSYSGQPISRLHDRHVASLEISAEKRLVKSPVSKQTHMLAR